MSTVRISNTGLVMFWCRGCSSYHGVHTQSPNELTGGKWKWNGDTEKPTIEPSILVHPSERLDADPPDDLSAEELEKWCDQHRVKTPLCHSFVRDGMIQYLSDCTHSLAGQTVEMEEED